MWTSDCQESSPSKEKHIPTKSLYWGGTDCANTIIGGNWNLHLRSCQQLVLKSLIRLCASIHRRANNGLDCLAEHVGKRQWDSWAGRHDLHLDEPRPRSRWKGKTLLDAVEGGGGGRCCPSGWQVTPRPFWSFTACIIQPMGPVRISSLYLGPPGAPPVCLYLGAALRTRVLNTALLWE